MKNFLIRIGFISILLIVSCNQNDPPKEILIYCGVTMINPLREIVDEFEKNKNCKIIISQGASEDLRNSLLTSEKGDLFLSGSSKFVVENEKGNIFLEELLYSYNRPAIFVQKGNPKNITGNLKNFANYNYSVVIGNYESSAIGIVTKTLLEKEGIFDEVSARSVKLASDSKDISRLMKEHKIDLTINWFTTSKLENNINYLQAIEISDSIVQKEPLYVYLLKYSLNKEIAKQIMDFMVSEKGKSIFQKYGFEVI